MFEVRKYHMSGTDSKDFWDKELAENFRHRDKLTTMATDVCQ